jgi:DNA adenine methylase
VQPAIESLPSADPNGRPFLKWAGGKRQLLPALLAHVPRPFVRGVSRHESGARPARAPPRYFEPFVGGGALFFQLRPPRAVLADVNERLIRTYRGVRDHVADVIDQLRAYPHTEKFFYELREVDIDARSDAEVAAWFIYLNRTGYNGLYRVNRRNRFNVPFGRYDRPTICDEPTLRACSGALAGAKLVVGDFERVVAQAKQRDFVYFDPPYVPLSVTSSFTSYTSSGFGLEGQTRLRDVALELKRRGVSVLLSNSSSPLVRERYKSGFEMTEVSATRFVNSNPRRRGPVTELIIR